MDGPYGGSSKKILETQHAILVGAGFGISRFAPILQDISIQLENNTNSAPLEKIDLHWIIEDHSYFEWFTKLLHEMKDESGFFNYHIYFADKTPAAFNEKLMYISTNAKDKKGNYHPIYYNGELLSNKSYAFYLCGKFGRELL